MATITRISTRDARFDLKPGEGADSVHTNPQYAYAVAEIHTDQGLTGIGLAFTLGDGTNLVCMAIQDLSSILVGRETDELMQDFGKTLRSIADHSRYRWLGPHKGVVHLALAAIGNACFDVWAKLRGVPLWQFLLDLSPEQIVGLLDLSYLEDVLTTADALEIMRANQIGRKDREAILNKGYPGYDTSVGWFNYPDDLVRQNVKQSMDAGFNAMKLKIGSDDSSRDIRRASMVRQIAGDQALIMLDCNQKWTLPQAIRNCLELQPIRPFWIEEPTHPDDIAAHQTLARSIAPMKIAAGEHLPNRIIFKNYLQAQAMHFCQADCVRLGSVSEFIAVSLMARKFGVVVVPHVGDMGQIHQHLVLFNHIVLGHEALFLEYIPHLTEYFVHPAIVKDGVYKIPKVAGSSSDLK
ncbi:MAG TPA: enolase C-terminal domain-like protein [Anaerolineales bacterium]|nr:enolase C-terminal domain-like protein [Anaerolineales bacterium]